MAPCPGQDSPGRKEKLSRVSNCLDAANLRTGGGGGKGVDRLVCFDHAAAESGEVYPTDSASEKLHIINKGMQIFTSRKEKDKS